MIKIRLCIFIVFKIFFNWNEFYRNGIIIFDTVIEMFFNDKSVLKSFLLINYDKILV